MAITNLNNLHLTDEQLEVAQNALEELENALAAINVNLTADDRRRYGSINEQNKLFVNKVNDYFANQPALSSPEVDWAEFAADYASRKSYEAIIARLDSLSQTLANAKILHDYDNYQSALTDYAYTAYKAGTSAPGYETKYDELKQFFARSSSTGGTDTGGTTG
ncbi:MAG: hypothetical protein QM642_00090 [Edaphocola sp.]